MDDEKPNTKHLALKPKEIEPMDKVAMPGDGTAISVRQIHAVNRIAGEKARKGELRLGGQDSSPPIPAGFKAPEIVPLDSPAGAGGEPGISVPGILLENRIAENRKGWGRLKHMARKKSRRNRDFLLCVGSIDLGICFVMWRLNNLITTVFCLAGLTLVTSMSAWIMYVVNDDY